MNDKDDLFTEAHSGDSPFRFDEKVARVFPDMINRSVPGYALMLDMIRVITSEHAKPGTDLYDLGCSLGASTLSMRNALPDGNYRIVGVDNSPPMIERCRINLSRDSHPAPVSLRCESLLDTEFSPASVVTLNFTLQFIPKTERQVLLQRIADALIPGGALILSEKLVFEKAQEEERLRDLHHAFKRSQGYSDLEVARKRAALDDVLVPESLEEHEARLLAVGFRSVTLWFQCFNFCSILAVR